MSMSTQVVFETPTENIIEIHRDGLSDTGWAYSQFRGYVLTCLYCEHETRGANKKEALDSMTKHYQDKGIKNVDLQ